MTTSKADIAKVLGLVPIKDSPISSATYRISPECARLILAKYRQHKDRGLSKHHVKKLAGALTRGEWHVTGHGIVFDINNAMIDGQHRLHAIILANLSMDITVTFGVDPMARFVIDTGSKPRSLTDVLGIKDFKYASTLNGALHWYNGLQEGPKELRRLGRLSTTQGLELAHLVPALGSWAETLHRMGLSRHVKNMAAMAALATVFEEACGNDDLVVDFFTKLTTGASMDLGHPILQLRELHAHLRKRDSGRTNHAVGKVPEWVGVALTMKAWRYFVQDRRVHQLCLRPGEEFPTIPNWKPTKPWPASTPLEIGYRPTLSSAGPRIKGEED